ncbi:hypothetical protein TrRE_jg12680 [Triparma retinervis]|uniref:Cyclic nucleotide-binding domain-containing protein n=1 Tax=Triparma retinervis TaxID=2557542 RepID=A0A9W7A8D0_9STRA|nr:hypothetical protein TrRE_jg12680 [Triparma retinervis]
MRQHERMRQNLSRTTLMKLDQTQFPGEVGERRSGREHKMGEVIDPAWKFQQNRDLFSVFVILYSVYAGMFEFAFVHDGSLKADYPLIMILDLFCTIYFWGDIFLNFTTAIYDTEDDLVTDRRKIVVTYMKGWFWIDVVSNLDINGALALLKILRLARFPRMFLRWANLGVSTMALNLFKILIMTLTAGHFFACCFFGVAVLEKHSEESWTRKDSLFYEEQVSCSNSTTPQLHDSTVCYDVIPEYGLGTMYIASLYFAYATLTTVGYGDISATTTLERGVALVALSIGSAIFAGIVGTMSTLVDTMDELEEMKLNKLKHIQQFIKSHHFPESIRTRIKKYYELHFQYLKKELSMLEELSPALRHECMHHIYAKILVKVPFLRDSPQIVQSAVIACVKPILCCKKDYLVIEGQVLDHIFLVASGAVEVINNKGLVSRTYGVGSFFGEKCAFHSHYLSTVSYRAKVDLEVLTIERNDFVDLLNTYEAFGETFMMICQKREDHKKGDVQGGTRMTGKLSKNAASMNIRFLDGSSIRSPKAVSSNTLATVSTVGSAVSSSAVPTAVGTRRRRSQLVRLDDVTGLGEAVDGPTNERARSVKRLIARENSRFRSVQSQRQLSSTDYGEYGISNEAPTLYTGETIDICIKRGPLGACKRTERRTVDNDNDKAAKYQKGGESVKVKEKDKSMRLGTDGVETSELIQTLQQRTDDNRERNLRIVEQKTFEANQAGYMGPFDRKVLIQNYGDEGSVEASGFTLLETPQAMRLKKMGYIEGRRFVKPVTKEIIDEAAVEEGNVFERIGEGIKGIIGGGD